MNDELPVDAKSLAKIAEATVSRKKLDRVGVKAIIERMRDVDLPMKKELIGGVIDSVQALLDAGNLTQSEQAEIKGVLDALTEESQTIDQLLARRRSESANV